MSVATSCSSLIDISFLLFEELGFGDVADGDDLAGYGGPDCWAEAGEFGASVRRQWDRCGVKDGVFSYPF